MRVIANSTRGYLVSYYYMANNLFGLFLQEQNEQIPRKF
jgi:hypothetical protein